MNQLLSIAIGGALGAVLRFMVVYKIDQLTKGYFPHGMLIVNVLGCILMGFFTILFLDKLAISTVWKVGILIGFLGGFTSFSSFSLDTLNLFTEGAYLAATLNILLNNGLCILATVAGIYAAKLL